MLRSIVTISTIFLLLSSKAVSAQDTLTVLMADQLVSDETQVTVPISFLHFDSISYFSFSIGYDSIRLDFNSISYPSESNLKEADFQTSFVNAGQIGLQWIDPQVLFSSVDDSLVVLNLVLDLKGDLRDTIKINFSNDPTGIEAGDVNGNEVPFKTSGANITFDQQSTSIEEVLSSQGIYMDQNSPNPFSEETQIRFETAKSEEVIFEVFDIQGRSILRQKSLFPKGNNIIKLNKLQLNGSGVYQYSLSIKQKTITKKLVLLN